MGALSFNEMEIDALGEMMNISLGASATAMSTLLIYRSHYDSKGKDPYKGSV